MGKGKFSDKILSFMGFEAPEDDRDEMYDEDMDFSEDDENLHEDMINMREDYYDDRENERVNYGRGKIVDMPDPGKVKVLIYKPSSYEDTQGIIDNLKQKKSIVINLDELEVDVAQRILDFISGAVYALSGNIRKAARNIFVIAPHNVDVLTNNGEDGDYDFGYVDKGDNDF